ncbi:MAG TPA: hypothetical protein DCG90_13150 [Sphingobium sp.]|uniref:hypothetical protein n=1 Tax=unclassified Sphingobium TaxID=2611147 RepID=UPI0007F3516B|nr:MULTISPECIES: hypothetical protein [unclassified Sphingobium]OAN57488.1 hypothetical protein A7Q26_16710 [Sphingobium sp. TCM1]WIW89044.1 hypothetical protein K3M67_03425 [Sphingobium sp. V4]HAF42691.1 hypothetical protein [Sphingobium sp.]
MTPEAAYRAASARAEEQRARLAQSAQAAATRIAPARLKRDAVSKLTSTALDGAAYAAAKVQQRPVAIGAAAAAFGLFLARRPLAALFGRLYVRFRNKDTDLSENDDG